MSQPFKDSLKELAAQHSQIFDALDALAKAGIKRELIPKLVVLGDQKSGKSSVLEAIAGIPFPVNENLCTKFPIEVIQRDASKGSVVITVVPVEKERPQKDNFDKGNDEKVNNGKRDTEKRKTESSSRGFFRRIVDESDERGLREAIEAATRHILCDASNVESLKHFSEDILRVTVCGPGRYPLTIIDLPGLWVSDTREQTSHDKESVDRMVRRYIEEPRNGILLVMTASKQWVGHVAPKTLSEVDPKGLRTLGIMTNPDKVYAASAIHNLFNGQAEFMPIHGWHCIRNRSAQEIAEKKNRDDLERDHFEAHWPDIDASCKGIESLKPKLGGLIKSQLKLHLPDLIKKVSLDLKSVKESLRHSKPARTTEQTQRSFLTGMAAEFSRLCYDAVGGHYGLLQPNIQRFFDNPGDSIESRQDKKLQAVARALSQLFNSAMLQKGNRVNLRHFGSSNSDDNPSAGLCLWDYKAARPTDTKTATKGSHSENAVKSTENGEGSTSTAANTDTKGKATNQKNATGKKPAANNSSDDEDDDDEDDDDEDDDDEDDDSDIAARILKDIAHFDNLDPIREYYRSQANCQPKLRMPTHDPSELLRHQVLQRYEEVDKPEEYRYEWFLEETLKLSARCRGSESLHEVNCATSSQLLKVQTAKWSRLSDIHFDEIWNAVERFVELALAHCVPDSMVPDVEAFIIRDRLDDLRQRTRSSLEEVLQCHTGLNPAFHDLLADLDTIVCLDAHSGEATSSLLEMVEREVFNRFDSASATNTMTNICETLWKSGLAASLSPTTHVTKLIFDKIQSQLRAAGDTPKPDARLRSSQRQEMEKLAVERAINTLKEYYKVCRRQLCPIVEYRS
ncbi:hypothetical protein MY10362_009749 [Beauveria mimosiformis]